MLLIATNLSSWFSSVVDEVRHALHLDTEMKLIPHETSFLKFQRPSFTTQGTMALSSSNATALNDYHNIAAPILLKKGAIF